MTNHIHILLKEENEPIELIIKRVGGSYAYWYNWKYYREGHLFQDRYRSEPVENDSYFLTVLRYIHQNPVKANIVKNVNEYEYSSYNDYIEYKNDLVNTDFAFSLMGKESFVEFHNEINNDICLDINERVFRLNDDDARKIIKKISKCENVSEFQSLEVKDRDKYLKMMKNKGLSIRQISRLTGISKGVVEKL